VTLHFKYHELFATWHAKSLKTLDQGFRKHLEAADAVLINFADKAENINIQNHFFDAQREIWLKMEDMTVDFHNLLEKQLGKSPDSLDHKKTPFEDESLDLLNLDIYEKNLALKTLAEKSVIENTHALYALRQRLTVIYGGIPIDLEHTPAAPEQICNVFSRCIDRLSLENDASLVLYTLFDKYVMSLLPGIYDALNQQLIRAGILPTLKYQVKTAEDLGLPPKADKNTTAAEPEQDLQQPGSAAKLGDETLLRIQDLLANNRARTTPRAPLPGGIKAATNQEIINTISTVPKDRETALPAEIEIGQPVDQLTIDKNLLGRIQESLAGQRDKVKRQVGRDRISDQQEDVIDVVGMLFEQVLDHEGIPGIVKALLGHLHTPYIKIGLRDDTFFSNDEHHARAFLNQSIEASISWTDEKDLNQGIYPLLRNTVHQIVKFRRQGQKDFIEFQDQLTDEVDRLSRKSKLLENRSQETEKGKAQLVKAKKMAQQATEKVFAGHTITPDCKQFIDEVWVDFLTLVLLRHHGKQNTAEWQAAHELALQLLHTSQQAAEGQAEQSSIDHLFTALEEQVGNLLPHQTKAIEQFIQSLGTVQQPTEIIAPTPPQAEQPADDQVDASLQQRLRELPPNTWFHFNIDTDQSSRAKRSWYNDFSDRILFVDQAGKKVELKSVSELATEINQGTTAYFLETKRSFWDTAMSAIRRLLEKPSKS